MEELHNGFDSSDDDFENDDDWDRTEFLRKPTHGKRQVSTLIARQLEDRKQSKRNSRLLTNAYGAPGTRYAVARVEAVWDSFYQGLGHDPKDCPTGEDIFRFVDTMTRHIVPAIRDKSAPSLVTIQAIWYQCISVLNFRHHDLKENYGKHQIARINVHLDQLVRRGLLIKGRWFKKQWFGFRVIEKLSQVWLETAISQGCISWDKVLLKLLNVVMLSTLAARCGDIARSNFYKGDEVLCWKDIELTLSSDATISPSVQSLTAKIRLRFLKASKDVRNAEDDVFVDPLKNQKQNSVCSIKLLMIVALRFGQVFGTTLSQVLDHTAQRVDKVVQWTRPDWPVFCRMNLGVLLPVREPAPYTQVSSSLRQMALAAGVLGHVTPHDIKRGSVRDTAYLKKTLTGVTNAAVGLVAHHKTKSTNAGVTGGYVGSLQTPMYNLRAESEFVDRLAPKSAAVPIVMKRNKGREIDEYMDKHEMDKKSAVQRNTAGKRLQEEQIEAWEQAERNRKVDFSPGAAGSAGKMANIPNGTGKILMFAHARQVPETLLAEKGPSAVNASQGGLARKANAKVLFNAHAEDIPIDPALLELDLCLDSNEQEVDEDALEALESIVFSANQESDTNDTEESIPSDFQPDEVDDVLIQSFLDDLVPYQQAQACPLTLEPDAFVAWFSVINVFKNESCKSSTKEDFKKHAAVGNSRDYPTRYLYHCGVGVCIYSSWDYRKLDVHQVICNGVNKASIQKDFSCAQCPLSFATEGSLQKHINRLHNFEPRPCAECPDQPEVLYASDQALRNHQVATHYLLEEPMKCPFHDNSCTCPEKVYTSSKLLKVHLQSVHKLTSDQIRQYVAYKERVHRPAKVWSCPVEPCTTFTGKNNMDLRNHLKRKHQMTEDEAIEKVPLSKAEKTSKENKAKKEPKETIIWKCPVKTCDSTTVLKTNERRRKHLINAHLWTEKRTFEFLPLVQRELTLLARKNSKQSGNDLEQDSS